MNRSMRGVSVVPIVTRDAGQEERRSEQRQAAAPLAELRPFGAVYSNRYRTVSLTTVR